MNKSNYTPTPIDISDVRLPRDMSELMEKLSENNHDIWARQRLKDGWTYGEERNDGTKKNPCLIPYNELSDEEKKYDNSTAEGTLKAIYKSGFAITKVITGNVMLVGRYTEETRQEFTREAYKRKLSLTFFSNWESACYELNHNLSKWNIIILDTIARLTDKDDTFFLRNALDDLHAIYSKSRNEIPWFILPSTWNELSDTLVKCSVGRERERKDWGKTVFKLDNFTELFLHIAEILPNTRNYRIRNIYDKVFDVLDSIYPEETKNSFTNILLPLHYPDIFYSYDPTEYYNGLRRILEETFTVCHNYGFIPTDKYFNEQSKVNLSHSCDYLTRGESGKLGSGIFPFSLATILESVLDLANAGSHTGNEFKTEGLYYSIIAYSLQLCDVIIWLGKHIKENHLVSLDAIKESYEGKEVKISKDKKGNYYYEKCLLPSNLFIQDIFNKGESIILTNIVRNTNSYTKKDYPFFAHY